MFTRISFWVHSLTLMTNVFPAFALALEMVNFPGNVTCTRINCTGHSEPMCIEEHWSDVSCCPTCMCPVEGTTDSFYAPGEYNIFDKRLRGK